MLEGLYTASVEIADRYRSPEIQSILPAGQKDIRIEFVNGDATKVRIHTPPSSAALNHRAL